MSLVSRSSRPSPHREQRLLALAGSNTGGGSQEEQQGIERQSELEQRETPDVYVEKLHAQVAQVLRELPERDITALIHGLSANDVVNLPSGENLKAVFGRKRSSELQEAYDAFARTSEEQSGDAFERFRDFIEGQSEGVQRAFLADAIKTEPRAALPVLAALKRKIEEIEQLGKDRTPDAFATFLYEFTDYKTLEDVAQKEGMQQLAVFDTDGTRRPLSPVDLLLQKYPTPQALQELLEKHQKIPTEEVRERRRRERETRTEGRWASWTDCLKIPGHHAAVLHSLRKKGAGHPQAILQPEKLQEFYDKELEKTFPGYIRSLRDCQEAILASLEAQINAKARELEEKVVTSVKNVFDAHRGQPNAFIVHNERKESASLWRIIDAHDDLRAALFPGRSDPREKGHIRIRDHYDAKATLEHLSTLEGRVAAFRDPVHYVQWEERYEDRLREQAQAILSNPRHPLMAGFANRALDGSNVYELLRRLATPKNASDSICLDAKDFRTAKVLLEHAEHPETLFLSSRTLQGYETETAQLTLRQRQGKLDIAKEKQELQKPFEEKLRRVRAIESRHPTLHRYLRVEESIREKYGSLFSSPENTSDLARANVVLQQCDAFLAIADIDPGNPSEDRIVRVQREENLPENLRDRKTLPAFFHQPDGKIYLNLFHEKFSDPAFREAREREYIHHEAGHALTYAFDQLFPNALVQIYEQLPEATRASLVRLATASRGKGGWALLEEGRAIGREEQRSLIDELFNQEATYDRVDDNGTFALTKRTKRLLGISDEKDPGEKEAAALMFNRSGQEFLQDYRKRQARFAVSSPGATEEEETDRHVLARAAAEEQRRIEREVGEMKLELHNLQERFSLIERWIYLLRGWVKTYAHLGGAAEWNAAIDGYEGDFQKLKREWLELNSKGIVEHARHEPFLNNFNNLYQTVEGAIGKMQEFDQEQLDLRGAPSEGRNFWIWLTRDIEWMTVWDMWAMVKDFGEDIKRQWKRRQEGVVGRVGHGITKWISDAVPYLGVLKHESRRREQDAELAEVEQWKKALKNMDKYEIRDFGLAAQTPDQLKAAIFELTERGDMNWQDERFWRKLSSFSHYTMPIEECRRNENLREQWLHKICGDIWNDHDLYHQWKKSNDSAIEGGKEKWRDECDRLSNIEGGLAGELARMLMLARQYQRDPENPAFRNGMRTVSHTKYEKIIFYSIDNGKMSMEQKLFYLVQGIDAGIIMPDRLRSMAGETGKVLNRFPVLDYFCQSNNTLPEFKALAHRLMENPDNPLDPVNFKPGTKTTMWLNIEVAREKKVQERLRKGIDRAANDMDHDDFHIFLPRLDASQIDQLAGPSGGARQKITRDAWQNGYVGFNAYFKSMGYLARMDAERVKDQKFAAEDAADVARAVGAYLKMDGILTQRFVRDADLRVRPYLTPSELASNRPVLGEKTVIEYKRPADRFAAAVLQAYGIKEQEIKRLMGSRADKDTEIVSRNTLCDNITALLQNKIGEQGTGPIKKLLNEHADHFETYGGGSIPTYTEVKEIFEKLPGQKRRFLAEASAA